MSNHKNKLGSLFAPKSIAIVGASNTPGKAGAVPVKLLLSQGYKGKIYPINPKEPEVQGLPAFKSIRDIGEPVDLAIIAVPANYALQALQASAPGQLANAVIFTSGFAEVGDQGQQYQQALKTFATEQGIRLLGPNCLGFMNIPQNVYATFSPAPLVGTVPDGVIGMVTQSGAFGAYAYSMARERGIGLSFWVSTGNESDVDVADCLQWLVEDPNTQVIMAYMEGCQNGESLKKALRSAHEAGKPVVVTKIGRTASGAKAAASHTASLAGNDAVYEALFEQYGAYRAHSMEEFFTLGHSLSIWRNAHQAQRSLGILTISGGVGALMADEADDLGLDLPALDQETQDRLLARIPFASAANPVDITGQSLTDPGLLKDTCIDMLQSGNFGSLAIFLAAAGSSESLWPHVEDLAQTLHARYPNYPLAICALLPLKRKRTLEQYGCMVFEDPSTAVQTLGKTLGRQITLPPPAHNATHQAEPLSPDLAAGTLSEQESLQVLSSAGVNVVQSRVVQSEDEAVAFSTTIKGPVVLKVASADILHKSDIGGVILNVLGEQEVRDAYRKIRQNTARNAPDARIDGVLVAPMIQGGVECILGIHRDPVFGPVVMFGLGGVFVEIFKDVTFKLAPFSTEQAHAMIMKTRAAQLLEGARGRPKADIRALAEALASVSRFAQANKDRIESIDINPLVVLPQGQGVVALDSVVVLR